VVAQVLGRLVGLLLSVLTLRLLTGYLGPRSYGELTSALAFVALFVVLADGGLGTIAAREMARDAGGAERLLARTLVLRALVSLCLVPISLGLGLWIFQGEGRISEGVAFLSCLIVLTTVQSALAVVFAARVRNDVTAGIDVAIKGVTLAGIGVVAAAHGGFRDVLLVYIVSSVVGLALAWLFAQRQVRARPSLGLGPWKPLVLLALPLGLVQLLNTLYYRLDTVMLSVLRPLSEVGYYGVAYRVIDIVVSVPSILLVALMPSLATADAARLQAMSQKALDVMIAMAVPVLVGGILLRRQIIAAVSSDAFRPAATPFLILLVGAAASFPNAVYGNVLVAIDRQSVLVRLTVVVLCVNLALNVLLIPLLGASGAAMATTACELTSAGYVMWLHRRETGGGLGYGQTVKSSLAAAAMLVAYLMLRNAYPLHTRSLVATVSATSILAAVYVAALVALRGVPVIDVRSAIWRRA
jgi:O-antigen/teichoic acid export membrane protein